jgi:Ca-activated chloride channel homolog
MALIEELLRQKEAQAQQPDDESGEAQNEAPEAQSKGPSQAQGSSQAETPAEPLSSTPQSPADEGAQASTGEAAATPPSSPDTPREPGAESEGTAVEAPGELDDERQQALEQWLRQIPDDPAELLRRKFWLEQQERQEYAP